jgi:hypothetical protein
VLPDLPTAYCLVESAGICMVESIGMDDESVVMLVVSIGMVDESVIVESVMAESLAMVAPAVVESVAGAAPVSGSLLLQAASRHTATSADR